MPLIMGRYHNINFPPRRDRESHVKKLRDLSIAKEVSSLRPTLACIFVLQYGNRLLGMCVVTWACVVVLGGFLDDIKRPQFMRVTFLLLLHALYLLYNTPWPYSVVRLADLAFYFGGRSALLPPPILPGRRSWVRYLGRLGILAFFVFTFSTSLVCMVFSTVVSLIQLPNYNLFDSVSIEAALKIFYVLVLCNALVGDVHLLLLTRAFITSKLGGRSICALSYFFRANTSSQGKAYFRSREVDLLDFVFDMMSDECGDSVKRICALHSLCLDLVAYVYYHPRGFEATLAAMDSPSYYVQEAASLMVGFLVHLESRMEPNEPRLLRLQEAIVGKLIDLGMGKGTVKGPRKDAALWSLLMLALYDPDAIIDQLPKSAQNLVEHGVQLATQEAHHGLGSLLIILSAVLKEDQYGIGPLLSDELMDKLRARVRPSSPELDQLLTLLQNLRTPPQDDEAISKDQALANPLISSEGIKTKGWIFLLLYIVTLGVAGVVGFVCYIVYKAILARAKP